VACCRDIKTADGTLLYRNPLVVSPSGMRPWAVVPGKENEEMVTDFSDFMDKESDVCREQIFESVLQDGKKVAFKNVIDHHLIDGKNQHTLLGLHGAFCNYCKVSFGKLITRRVLRLSLSSLRPVGGPTPKWPYSRFFGRPPAACSRLLPLGYPMPYGPVK
jgi:hypothetical protein